VKRFFKTNDSMENSDYIPPEWLLTPFYLPQIWDTLVPSPSTVSHPEGATTMAAQLATSLHGIINSSKSKLTADAFLNRYPDWAEVSNTALEEGLRICGCTEEGSISLETDPKLIGRCIWAQPVPNGSGGHTPPIHRQTRLVGSWWRERRMVFER
jgi:hypothetical protein